MTDIPRVTSTLDIRRGGRWTPARWFLLAMAASHLPLGVMGLLIDRSFPVGANAAESAGSAHVFGLFETNGWHSLAALLLGVLALSFAVYPTRARTVAIAIGVSHVAIVLSLVVGDPSTFWFASNNADQVVHASTAVGGTVSGLLTPLGTGTVTN